MSGIEDLRNGIVAVGQEFVGIEEDKIAFVQGEIPPVQGRIREAAGVANHLGGLIRGIMSDLYSHNKAAGGFDERREAAIQHLQALIGEAAGGHVSEFLAIMPPGKDVDVRHDHKDTSPLQGNAMKAEAIAKSLGILDQKLTSEGQIKAAQSGYNITRIEGIVQRTTSML